MRAVDVISPGNAAVDELSWKTAHSHRLNPSREDAVPNLPYAAGKWSIVQSVPRLPQWYAADAASQSRSTARRFRSASEQMLKRTFMRSPQDHARRLPCLQRFLPPRCAQTPAITGLQSRKAEFRDRRREVIAAGLRKLEKSHGHDGAHGVAAGVLPAGVAAAIAKESRHRAQGADFQSIAQHVLGLFAGPRRLCPRLLSTSEFFASPIPPVNADLKLTHLFTHRAGDRQENRQRVPKLPACHHRRITL